MVELTEFSKKQLRNFIEGINIRNIESIRLSLSALLQNNLHAEEDYIIVALNEAITNKRIEACDGISLAISWLLKVYKHRTHRKLLQQLAEGLSSIDNKGDFEWSMNLILNGADVPIKEGFYNDLPIVNEVRQLFWQANFSTALDERCKPVSMTCYTNA